VRVSSWKLYYRKNRKFGNVLEGFYNHMRNYIAGYHRDVFRGAGFF
jgi:hypothetical protein